jgi:peptidoglycan hydrolase-like protein with peptidoglycan-binding domain
MDMQSKQLAIAVAAAFVFAAPAFAAGDYRGQSSQDTMSKSSESSAHAQSSTAVREAQQALKDKGFDAGPIDGIMGPKTSAAVKEFQQAQGLKSTGQLDAQTLSALDVQATGMGSGAMRSGRSSGGMSGPTRSSDATSPSPSSTQSGKTTSPSPAPTQSSGTGTDGSTTSSSPAGTSERPLSSRSSDATSPSPSSTESGKSAPSVRSGG